MPTISLFFGIVIRMYYEDHNPPHFHAYYGDFHVTISIERLEIINGSMPKRALSLIIEWAIDNRQNLLDNWKRAEEHKPLKQIDPLD